MAYYPHLVQTSWHAVEQLVKEWIKNPHYWEREIDIQSELRARLSSIFSLTGFGHVVFQEQEQSPSDPKTYHYSRVACEPTISYTYQDGNKYRAMPDVVVWDDLPDPKTHLGEDWSILWACEIKYRNDTTSSWDIEKLGYLLDQGRIRYGCWLVFKFEDSLSEPLVSWEKSSHGTRLWKCTVSAPSSCGTKGG